MEEGACDDRRGSLGEVRAIQTIFSYYLDDPGNVRNQADIGGGGLFDVGCYAINTARFLFDAEPVQAIALMERDPVFGTDRLTSGLLAFPEESSLPSPVPRNCPSRKRLRCLERAGVWKFQFLSMHRPMNRLSLSSMTAVILLAVGARRS